MGNIAQNQGCSRSIDSAPKKHVVGYIRCSSVLQVRDGETLETQEAKIKEYCHQKGIVVDQIISDEGISGFKTKSGKCKWNPTVISNLASRSVGRSM